MLGFIFLLIGMFGFSRRRPKADGVMLAGRFMTWDQLLRHVLYMGSSGSGKTYASNHLVRELMRAGCPGIYTCVKTDDCDRLLKLAREAGQMHRVRVVKPGGEWRMNMLDQYMAGHNDATVAAKLIKEVGEVGERADGGSKGENAFFVTNTERCTEHAIALNFEVRGSATIPEVFETIISSPRTLTEVEGLPQWDSTKDVPRGRCATLYTEACRRGLHPNNIRIYNAVNYLTQELPSGGDRVRGSILSGVANTLGRFINPPWRDTLCSTTTLSPEMIDREGLIAILDMPVLRWHTPARMAMFAWTMAASLYCLSRPFRKGQLPFVICRDEVGFLMNPGVDARTALVARSQGLMLIDLVQDLESLNQALGIRQSDPEAMSFIANHGTKLLFGTPEGSTTEWMSKLCGEYERAKATCGGGEVDGFWGQALGARSGGWTLEWRRCVRPEQIASLRVGESIVYSNGEHYFYKHER